MKRYICKTRTYIQLCAKRRLWVDSRLSPEGQKRSFDGHASDPTAVLCCVSRTVVDINLNSLSKIIVNEAEASVGIGRK